MAAHSPYLVMYVSSEAVREYRMARARAEF
jgi:hypothetical protein